MAKRRMGIISIFLCLCLCLAPCRVQAASVTDGIHPISVEKDCQLTLCYGYDQKMFSDVAVKLYKIADISAAQQYTLTSPFADTNLTLNGIQSAEEWNVIRSTLQSHIVGNSIKAGKTKATNGKGAVCFDQLQVGLYLATVETVVQGDVQYEFAPVLISLPGLDAQGGWQYTVTVTAKGEMSSLAQPEEEIQLKVVKLWKGDTNALRPQNVEIEIFRNGTSFQKVRLLAENDWSFHWSAKKDGATWTVTERNVPLGYTMTVEQRDTSFVVTNTRISKPSDPPSQSPQTGDTANISLYILLMNISGILLIILGITGKRKRK